MSGSHAIRCYAQLAPGAGLRPWAYDPPPLGPHEVEVRISHCGVCHSDLDVLDEAAEPPIIPGHEIVGTVVAVGAEVSHLAVGARVGVGWQCGACFGCRWCRTGREQYCPSGVATCMGRPGGFAERVRVDGRFAFELPADLPPESAAPLFCAGVTVYSALARHAAGATDVAVVGFGGLGHLAVQYAAAMGHTVTAVSRDPSKRQAALACGASAFVAPDNAGDGFDVVLSTAPAAPQLRQLLSWVRPGGRVCLVGLPPPRPVDLLVADLVDAGKSLCGSVIGSRADVRAALDLSVAHRIRPVVQVEPMSRAAEVLADLRAGRARYRYVLANDRAG